MALVSCPYCSGQHPDDARVCDRTGGVLPSLKPEAMRQRAPSLPSVPRQGPSSPPPRPQSTAPPPPPPPPPPGAAIIPSTSTIIGPAVAPPSSKPESARKSVPPPLPARAAQAPRPSGAPPAAPKTRRSTPPPLPAAARGGPPTMQKLRAIDGKYLVRGTIGSGGMGVVLEAEHIGIGRVVAIKVLHPHLGGDEVQLKRFMREARTAGMCGHPNVAVVYDAGTLEDGRPYIVMERLYGQSLATRIADGRTMTPEEAVDVVLQALSALDAVHRAGVVHRDVKPDNVFLVDRTAEGAKPRAAGGPFVKVLDFGTSKPIHGSGNDLTGTGIAIGTAYYMSPEQARGERDLDGRVDVYACGVMLYEMLTGVRPFVAPSEHGILLKILGEEPQPVTRLRPNVPRELEAVIKKAMAREREDRYPTAEALIEALEAIRPLLADPVTSSRARPQPPPAPLPDSVRVPVVQGAMTGAPPSARTHTGFYEEPTPLINDAAQIRALARAAMAGAAKAAERERGTSPPSEPTMPIASKDARALAAASAKESPPTGPTRRVDPVETTETQADLEETHVHDPRRGS